MNNTNLLKRIPIDIYKIIFNMYFDIVVLDLVLTLQNYKDQYYVYKEFEQDTKTVIYWNLQYPFNYTEFTVNYITSESKHRNITKLIKYSNYIYL